MALLEKSRFRRYLQLSVETVSNTFKRFPLTILLFLGLAGIIIYRIETPYEKLKDINLILDRLIGVMALGVPMSLSLALLFERFSRNVRALYKIGSYLGEIVLLFLYYQFLFTRTDQQSVTRLLMVILATILSFLFIPYLPRKENFEIYITRIITAFATTAFYTIALALGVMAILFAVKSLLFSSMSEKLYLETWVLAWLVFAPLYFLSILPRMEDRFNLGDFNKVLQVMLLYIALPVISVYTLVLYIYFGKIVITQVWPKGIVSYLVVSYSAVGIAAIFLVSPFREGIKWVRLFTAAMTKLIFPLLAMMFMSISIRVGEFGFTENRYFILAIGIWATLVMIFLNFDRGKRSVVLPISLAVIALLTVFGPWNAFETSISSQNTRFFKIAQKYDLIQNNEVVKNNKPVAEEDRQEISGILRYFAQSHQLKDLKYLPAGFTMQKMEKVFGFAEVYPSGGMNQNYFSYGWDSGIPLDIAGYEMFFRMEAFPKQTGVAYQREIDHAGGKIRLSLGTENILTVDQNGKRIYQYDLMPHLQRLHEKYGSNINGGPKAVGSPDATSDGMILKDETPAVKILIVFNNINGSVDGSQKTMSVENINAEIFLTVK